MKYTAKTAKVTSDNWKIQSFFGWDLRARFFNIDQVILNKSYLQSNHLFLLFYQI